jgi:hypothetical protein
MDELLSAVLDADGGLDNWQNARTLTARLRLGGPFWGARGPRSRSTDPDEDSLAAAAQAATEVSILVTNAGIGLNAPVLDAPLANIGATTV